MFNILSKIKDKNLAYVLSHSYKSMFVQVSGTLAAYLVSIYIANKLGSDAIGILGLSNKIAMILVTVGIFGMNKVVIKKVSYELKIENFKKINNIIFSVKKFTLNASFFLLLFAFTVAPLLSKYIYKFNGFLLVLCIISTGVIFQIRSRILSSALIAYNKIWQGNLVDKGLTPIYMLSLFVIYYFFQVEINIMILATTYLVARIFMYISIEIYWKLNSNFKTKAKYFVKDLLPMGKSVMIISITAILFKSIDLIILGFFEESSKLGLFHIASRLAMINIFILTVVNKAVGPKLSILFKTNDFNALNKLLIKLSAILFFLGLLSFLIIVIFGKPILSIWGQEFVDAYIVLILLSFGQLINISTSVCSEVLIMCGLENLHKKINLYFLIIHFFLSLTLIYFHGILGASISFMIIVASINLVKLYYCRNKLNLFVLNA